MHSLGDRYAIYMLKKSSTTHLHRDNGQGGQAEPAVRAIEVGNRVGPLQSVTSDGSSNGASNAHKGDAVECSMQLLLLRPARRKGSVGISADGMVRGVSRE